MSLLPLIAIAVVGAVGAAAGGATGRRGTAGTVVALVALVAVLVTAVMQPVTGTAAAPAPDGAGAFERILRPNDYQRLAVVLWAFAGLGLAALAALVGGGGRLLVATLGSIAAGATALGSGDLVVSAGAGIAAGLAGFALLPAPPAGLTAGSAASPGGSAGAGAGPGPSATAGTMHGVHLPAATVTAAAARELRDGIVAGVLVLAGAVVAPVAGAALFAIGSADADAGSGGPAAAVGLAAVALAVGTAIRAGAVPFHLRVARLTDLVAPVAQPLVLAWALVPLGAAALTAVDRTVAPLALPLGGERIAIIALALLTLSGGALAAWIRDDIRHVAGYLVVADAGLLLLALAAADPAAWEPGRIWLLTFAMSRTALGAWVAATEARFGTRALGDLRGWARRAPLLGLGFTLAAVGAFGLPGWVGWSARTDLGLLAAATPWGPILFAATFLTLPVWVRVLLVGLDRPVSRVAGAAPERLLPFDRPDLEGTALPAATRRLAEASAHYVRTNAAPFASGIVVILAVLAVLTAWGMVDLAGAAAQPAPLVQGVASD